MWGGVWWHVPRWLQRWFTPGAQLCCRAAVPLEGAPQAAGQGQTAPTCSQQSLWPGLCSPHQTSTEHTSIPIWISFEAMKKERWSPGMINVQLSQSGPYFSQLAAKKVPRSSSGVGTHTAEQVKWMLLSVSQSKVWELRVSGCSIPLADTIGKVLCASL